MAEDSTGNIDRSLDDLLRDSPATGRRVFVGNLSYDTRWQGLKDYMGSAGTVNYAEVLMDDRNRSKGCGIVEFATAEDAQNAIKTLNDTNLDGRLIFVREDREDGKAPRQGAPRRGGFPGRGRGGFRGGFRGGGGAGRGGFNNGQHNHAAAPPADGALTGSSGSGVSGSASPPGAGGARSGSYAGRKLYVGNLPYNTTWHELKDLFAQVGNVNRADVLVDYDGRPKGSGTVIFATEAEAKAAVERFNGFDFQGRALLVREDRYA